MHRPPMVKIKLRPTSQQKVYSRFSHGNSDILTVLVFLDESGVDSGGVDSGMTRRYGRAAKHEG
jgi:hypothetical protein